MASENGHEKRETPEDIVAEIRAYGAQPPPRLMWLDIADRIEAAWKREAAEIEVNAAPLHAVMLTTKAKIINNAAAMREALCEIAFDCQYAIEGISDKGDYGRSSLSRVLGKARAALSAPARNCDRFGTDNTEAELAYEEFCEKSETYESITGAFEWLFAPAEERKGEGDGR